MKKWEEQRRKKLYDDKINKAKPTLKTQPKSGTRQSQTSVSSSKGFNATNTSVSTRNTKPLGGGIFGISDEMLSDAGDVRMADFPIFQLLKAFKLQQYTLKLVELGYGEELYKLALLNERQREDLVTQLKVLPGHKAKLFGLFSVIDEIYPKKIVAEQLKQFTPGGQQVPLNEKKQPKTRILSAHRGRQPGSNIQTTKSLLQQYESLDPITKQAFNDTFLANLESVKYNMGQLMQQHVNKEESKKAINSIFPPTYFGYGGKIDQMTGGKDDTYNQEIENLLRKYTTTGNYKNYNNPDALEKCTGYGDAKHLKNEIQKTQTQTQALVKEERKNVNASVGPKSQQKQTKQDQSQQVKKESNVALKKQQQKKEDEQNKRDIEASSKLSQQRPASRYEVFTDDQDKSQASVKITDDSNIVDLSESTLLDDALDILNDPLALSLAIKEQYDKIVAMAETQKKQQIQQQMQEDVSMLNPLGTGDDSKLNITSVNIKYQKQQVYEEPLDIKRPLSPLIDKEERNRVWNLGQSLNSKQVTSALGYLDLKQICYCLAHAVMKHIDFAQGFYYLDDLQEFQKKQIADEGLNSAGGLQGKELEFTYNLQDQLKIDIDQARENKRQKEELAKKEFEALKQKMEQSQIVSPTRQSVQKIKEESKVKDENDNHDYIEDQDSQQQEDEQDIEAEEEDEMEDESGLIQDYYDDIDLTKQGEQKIQGTFLSQQNNENDEDIDFDYSQSHLDDFLKSHNQNTLLKGSNIQSTQLLNTFLSSYNKMRSGTGKSLRESGLGGMGMQSSKFDIQPIQENLEQSESERSETQSKLQERRVDTDEDEEEDLGRSSEKINLNEVEVTSKGKRTPQRPILTQQEVANVKQKEEQKQTQQQPSIKIDVKTKKGFKDLLRFQMRVFEQNYDFEQDQLIGGESMFSGNPTLEELYYYFKYVIISGRMEKEIPILCLVYIERFTTKTGILMNYSNWKRISLIALLLASKIWDDDSLENVHFPQVMPDVTLKEITSLEKVFLSLLDFDLVIRGSEYAKYYFILKTFAEKFNSTLPMGPLSVEQMSDLQNNTVKAESDLREKYNIKVSLKKTMQIIWYLSF